MSFDVFLTHDIDLIHPSMKYRLYTALKFVSKFKFKSAVNRILKDEPFLNFKEIMKLEESYGAKSTFFIMGIGYDGIHHFYDVEELEHELGNIIDNEFEIALHGGYNSFDNMDAIKSEKSRLEKVINRKVVGYRNHFLRMKIPDTWKILHELGFKYDSTFGYRKKVGYRDKKMHPFFPDGIEILEIPLVIMDTALLHYMQLNLEDAWMECRRLIDIAIENEGVVTILWHNFSFDDIRYTGWGKLYEKILKYCYNNNAQFMKGEEIYRKYGK
ncbi:MAG: hypothetical protein DRN29_09680 [Thermoplasmata archaeon]|nr:MAG: hypothetical protein DRN29_09680 [Thermoplasmata archaeon]